MKSGGLGVEGNRHQKSDREVVAIEQDLQRGITLQQFFAVDIVESTSTDADKYQEVSQKVALAGDIQLFPIDSGTLHHSSDCESLANARISRQQV